MTIRIRMKRARRIFPAKRIRLEGDELGAALGNGWSIPEVMAGAYAQGPIHASPSGHKNGHLPHNLTPPKRHLPSNLSRGYEDSTRARLSIAKGESNSRLRTVL